MALRWEQTTTDYASSGLKAGANSTFSGLAGMTAKLSFATFPVFGRRA